MTIHKEGRHLLLTVASILVLLNILLAESLAGYYWLFLAVSIILFLLVMQFFRHPERTIEVKDNRLVYAPADGRIVAIEETKESEYLKDRRLQVSIFMSPLNVHVNRNPVSGEVKYVKHHPGKYLVASHPKSSTENERTTVVIDGDRAAILLRQIAGAMARRIVTYLEPGRQVEQGGELGFIKFGSRVDVFLPLDAEVLVKIEDRVKGNKTVLARLV